MPLQDRFIFRFSCILTVIFISLILVNPHWSFAEDATQVFRKLAEQGYANAQSNLGLIYDNGQGVLQDYKEAARWYRKAAEQGVADAQYNLGLMYFSGQGVPQDYKKAYAWLNLAASQGNAEAANIRDYLADRFMTPQQIASAQELTAELQADIEGTSKGYF